MTPGIILAAIDGVMKLIDFINRIRTNNAVTSAWTPAERAQVDSRWTDLQNSPAWKTDAQKAGG